MWLQSPNHFIFSTPLSLKAQCCPLSDLVFSSIKWSLKWHLLFTVVRTIKSHNTKGFESTALSVHYSASSVLAQWLKHQGSKNNWDRAQAAEELRAHRGQAHKSQHPQFRLLVDWSKKPPVNLLYSLRLKWFIGLSATLKKWEHAQKKGNEQIKFGTSKWVTIQALKNCVCWKFFIHTGKYSMKKSNMYYKELRQLPVLKCKDFQDIYFK